ncbi:transposase, partial [Myxococcota bacterium]|nr:transposase [Myxococcota bacterium]MBU1429575.1 transposase [Myxococcota bacterium]
LSKMTARLEDPGETVTADFWLRVSSLEFRQSIWLPLVGNPYIQQADHLSKGIQARKTKTGRWRFEAVEKSTWEAPEPPEDAHRLGVDVGLNVLAATSDGVLYGEHVKPKFDKLYQRIKRLRANRQRQGFKENSPRLDRLESRLSGLVKTETGRVANTLVRKHPDTVFVVEDLDLRGCRGQKRFAYRALQTNLERKALVEKVNPAYTSQECPSCGYVSRQNRSGIKFVCKCCGRRAHADWVGASGILRRSGDKDVGRGDHPRDVKRVLRERYLLCRDSSSGFGRGRLSSSSPSPLGRRLTTRGSGSAPGTGTASNSMPTGSSGRF